MASTAWRSFRYSTWSCALKKRWLLYSKCTVHMLPCSRGVPRLWPSSGSLQAIIEEWRRQKQTNKKWNKKAKNKTRHSNLQIKRLKIKFPNFKRKILKSRLCLKSHSVSLLPAHAWVPGWQHVTTRNGVPRGLGSWLEQALFFKSNPSTHERKWSPMQSK